MVGLKLKDMFDEIKRDFKVGDVIVVKNFINTYSIKVTRVTKTQAICVVKRKDGTGYTAKYKKTYSFTNCHDGTKHFYVTPIPRIEWNTNEYTVISED